MKELAVVAEFTRCGINRCATMLLPKLVCLFVQLFFYFFLPGLSKAIWVTLVIFLGSDVPVSNTSTFWYTFGEFTHLPFFSPLLDLAICASRPLSGESLYNSSSSINQPKLLDVGGSSTSLASLAGSILSRGWM